MSKTSIQMFQWEAYMFAKCIGCVVHVCGFSVGQQQQQQKMKKKLV